MLYVLQENKINFVFCSLSYAFYLIGDKISSDHYEDEITPLLKANERHTFSKDVVLNHVRDNGKPRYKLSYKLLKEKDEYYPLLYISPYPTLIQVKDYLGGSTILLQLLVSGFLTVIFFLTFLSQKPICTTVALLIMKKMNE